MTVTGRKKEILRGEEILMGLNDSARITILETSPIPGDLWLFRTDGFLITQLGLASNQIVFDAIKDTITPELKIYADDTAFKFKENSRNWLSANYDDREIHFCEDIAPDQLALPVFFDDKHYNHIFKIDGFEGLLELRGNIVLNPVYGALWPDAKVFIGGLTNRIAIDGEGDIIFENHAGLQFGEIYFDDTTFNIQLPAQDTDYQVTGFNIDGYSNADVTPDQAQDHITTGKAGVYLVGFSGSVRSAQSNIYQFHLKYNNGTVDVPNSFSERHTTIAGKIGPIANVCYAKLPADATLELWVRRIDGGAVNKTVTVGHINMFCVQTGGFN